MSLLLQIEVAYDFDRKVKELSKDERDNIRSTVLAFKELKEPKDKDYYSSGIYGSRVVVTEDEFEYLTEGLGLPVNVKKFKNNYTPSKIGDTNNTKYHFHLPNTSLLEFDKVTWLEDACTEELQEHLDLGWRIIAVCPPNGTRRPDYILGSNSNTMENNDR